MERRGVVKKMIQMITSCIFLYGMFLVWPQSWANGAPPILNEVSEREDAEKKQEQERKKTPEEEKKEKEENEFKKNLGNLGRRQEQDEKSMKIRANIYQTNSSSSDCTGADKARSRLDDVGDEGGIVIQGNVNINSKNEANVGKNEGSISSNTTINITNQNNKRC